MDNSNALSRDPLLLLILTISDRLQVSKRPGCYLPELRKTIVKSSIVALAYDKPNRSRATRTRVLERVE
jgi:hypothetical protein